jgi:hypothetical protein
MARLVGGVARSVGWARTSEARHDDTVSVPTRSTPPLSANACRMIFTVEFVVDVVDVVDVVVDVVVVVVVVVGSGR